MDKKKKTSKKKTSKKSKKSEKKPKKHKKKEPKESIDQEIFRLKETLKNLDEEKLRGFLTSKNVMGQDQVSSQATSSVRDVSPVLGQVAVDRGPAFVGLERQASEASPGEEDQSPYEDPNQTVYGEQRKKRTSDSSNVYASQPSMKYETISESRMLNPGTIERTQTLGGSIRLDELQNISRGAPTRTDNSMMKNQESVQAIYHNEPIAENPENRGNPDRGTFKGRDLKNVDYDLKSAEYDV